MAKYYTDISVTDPNESPGISVHDSGRNMLPTLLECGSFLDVKFKLKFKRSGFREGATAYARPFLPNH